MIEHFIYKEQKWLIMKYIFYVVLDTLHILSHFIQNKQVFISENISRHV